MKGKQLFLLSRSGFYYKKSGPTKAGLPFGSIRILTGVSI